MIVCWEISIKKAIRVARIRKRPVLPAPASSMGGVRGLSPSWYLGALFPVYLDARAPQKVTYLSGFFRKKFLTRAQRSRRPIKQKRPVFRGCRPFLREASGEKQAVPRHILVFVDYRRLGGRKISAFPKITAQQAHRRDSSVEQGLAEPNPTGVLPRPAGRHPKQARPLVGQIRQARNSALAA